MWGANLLVRVLNLEEKLEDRNKICFTGISTSQFQFLVEGEDGPW